MTEKIAQSVYFIVEGQDDESFLTTLLEHRFPNKKGQFKIFNAGSKDAIRHKISDLLHVFQNDDFPHSHVTIVPLIDHDDQPFEKTFNDLSREIREGNKKHNKDNQQKKFDVPRPTPEKQVSEFCELKQTPLLLCRTAYFFLPNHSDPKMLESLALRVAKGYSSETHLCLEDFFKCANNHGLKPYRDDKSRLQAFIAVAGGKDNSVHLLLKNEKEHGEKAFFDFTRPELDSLIQFLTQVFDLPFTLTQSQDHAV